MQFHVWQKIRCCDSATAALFEARCGAAASAVTVLQRCLLSTIGRYS